MKAQINGIRITAIAGAIPKNKKTPNEMMNGALSDTDIVRFRRKTGFEYIHYTDPDMTVLDLACTAANTVLDAGLVERSQIDALVMVTTSQDYILPNDSSIMQHKLGLSNDLIALDINQGCPGYIQGLYVVANMLASGGCKHVLLCVGETRSKQTNPQDRKTRTLFGDGATCTLVEKGEDTLFFTAQTYGEWYDKIIIRRGGSRLPKVTTREDEEAWKQNFMQMDGTGMTDFVMSHVPKLLKQFLAESGFSTTDITLYMMHQANKIFMKNMALLLNVPSDRVPFVAGNTGNTSANSIALGLSGLDRSMRDIGITCLCAFGVGLSIGIGIVDLSETKILGIKEI